MLTRHYTNDIINSQQDPGRLTQLIECHLDVVEVVGLSPSSPMHESKKNTATLQRGVFFAAELDTDFTDLHRLSQIKE